MSISPFENRYKTKMNEIFEDKNKYSKWMDVETSLAKAHFLLGNITKKEYEEIKNSKDKVKTKRIDEIEEEIHHDLMAMVKAMSEQAGESGGKIHLGATSYDIEDTATALIFKDAIGLLESHLNEFSELLKKLAKEYKETVCIARTHGQHATPTTYGMKFALYFQESKRNLQRLNECKKRIFVGKMSGAVGTGATFGDQKEKIEKIVMDELGLVPAKVTTQVIQRDRHAEVLSILSLIASMLEKIAKEIRNLQRTEILEASEPFGKKQVGSSTMPHKRNPHKSERVCSLARLVRSNLMVAYENISLEHERDLTNSANERVIFSQMFIATDYMLSQMKMILETLELFPENMKRNLELTNGLIMAERIMIALSKKGVGRQDAHEIMRNASQNAFKEKKHLRTEIEKLNKFSKKEIDELFDYKTYIGNAKKIIEDAIKD